MIDPNQLSAVQRSLASDQRRLYAVLDGASLPNLPAVLAGHVLEHICLLPGELDPDLTLAAPYLAELPAGSPFAAEFLTEGLGRHWGILAAADAPFRDLRMHLRKFLSVWDPDGKPLFFRYYDPRVLRIYLPTCTAEELAVFFGPITAFYAEGEEPASLIRFTAADHGLGRQVLSLAPPGAQPGAPPGAPAGGLPDTPAPA